MTRVSGPLWTRPDWETAVREDGFSAIEMMIVLAVIAILALMAVPSYMDKFVKDQIVEALPLADIAKAPIGASWALVQTFPADNAAAGLPAADKIVSNFISSLAVRDGAIYLTFGNRANFAIKGKILTLRPAVVEDAPVVPVAWICGHAKGPEKMTIKGVNSTNIAVNYLPLKCRDG